MASSSKKRDSSSITPQRKHRKLLKDGSGTEVWPEAIEKIFVQGLREYWDSPYATYSQSRGRSRWRNQFLVDYLQKQGIERSKKQVASHIQVLRNMWKGEPEFHLVAGGDEAYPEASSPISVKAEDHWESQTVPVAYEWDEHDNTASNSVSPDFSPADSQSEFPPTPEHRPNLYPTPDSKLNLINFADYAYPTNPAINSPSISPQGDYIRQLPPFHDSPSGPSLLIHPKYQSPTSPLHQHHHHRRTGSDVSALTAMNRHMSVTPTHHHSRSVGTAPVISTTRNKVLSVFLSAEGMTLFQVKVDALGLPHPATGATVQPPFSLRVKLGIPIAQDPRAPSSLAGFTAALTLESVWSASSRIHTKTYSGNVCVNDEMGSLDVTHITVGTVHAVMSESTLSRCRWLDHSLPVLITQEIIVDDETLLFIIYELDRRNGGQSMPSATLLGYQKYRGSTSTSTATFGLHSHHPSPLGPSPTSPMTMTMSGLGLGGSSMPMGLASPLSSSPGANSGSHASGYPRSPSVSSVTAMSQNPSYGMSQPQPIPAYRLGTTGLKY